MIRILPINPLSGEVIDKPGVHVNKLANVIMLS